MAYNTALPRLPDPSTTPAAPGWSEQSIDVITPNMHHSLNGPSTVTVLTGTEYWIMDLSYPQLPASNVLWPFIRSIAPKGTKFYVQLPNAAYPSAGKWAEVDDVHTYDELFGKGQLELDSSNVLKINDSTKLGGSLSVGDWFKLSNSGKIYYVTNREITGSVIKLTTSGPIVNSVDSLTYLEPNDVKFQVSLKSAPPKLKIDTTGLASAFTLSLREDI